MVKLTKKKKLRYKKLKFLLLLLILIGLGLGFKSWNNPKNHPEKQSGKSDTLINESASEQKVKIKVGGYYDLLALKADALVAGREFPIVGQKTVGQFFKKNQEVTLSPNAEVEMVPSQFDKITVVNNEIRLTDSGNYLIDKQFPAGDYELSLAGPVTVRDSVQLIVQTFSGKTKQEFSLSSGTDKLSLTVSKSSFLRIKMGLNQELAVILKAK